MNKLSTNKRAVILSCLVEGNSIRATCRMTGAAKGTVLKLLGDVGRACWEYQDKALRNLPCCRHIQADEIWSFCYAKAKNVPESKKGQWGYGDVWTWTALCADCKLVPSWPVGPRNGDVAAAFMLDLKERLANRIQLTTDGHKVYLNAVEEAFGADIDYAMLVKVYGVNPEAETWYSPAECIGIEKIPVNCDPKPNKVSTPYVERQNLTMRMSMRRFTRLTNAFSKQVENLEHAVALHFMFYNFARIHQTLRVTPAQEAGITQHAWTIEDIAALVD